MTMNENAIVKLQSMMWECLMKHTGSFVIIDYQQDVEDQQFWCYNVCVLCCNG